MDLSEHVETIQRHFVAAAEAGGEEARVLAERLFAPLEAAVRLAFQDVLAAAAEEITTDLAPGSVEVRLRGRQPEFVVTPPPPAPDDREDVGVAAATPEGDDGGTARINLRLPEQVKARVEQAAAREGLSVNSWLVRVAASALDRQEPPRTRTRYGPQRFTGWTR